MIQNELYDPLRYLKDIGTSLSDFREIEKDGKAFFILGKGNFAYTEKMTSIKDNKIYAIKKLDISGNFDVKSFERETKISIGLNHENIVRFYGYFQCEEKIQKIKKVYENDAKRQDLINQTEDKKIYCLVLEFAENGSLQDYYKKYKAQFKDKESFVPLDQKIVLKFAKQILYALKYIHQMNIAHRDIKPDNILLDKDNNIKIADFGISAVFKDDNNANENVDEILVSNYTTVGRRDYVCPEIYKNQAYDCRCDIYSLGLTLLYLMSYDNPIKMIKDPITGQPNRHINKKIDSNAYNDYFIKLVFRMLEEDINDRPFARQAYDEIGFIEKIIEDPNDKVAEKYLKNKTKKIHLKTFEKRNSNFIICNQSKKGGNLNKTINNNNTNNQFNTNCNNVNPQVNQYQNNNNNCQAFPNSCLQNNNYGKEVYLCGNSLMMNQDISYHNHNNLVINFNMGMNNNMINNNMVNPNMTNNNTMIGSMMNNSTMIGNNNMMNNTMIGNNMNNNTMMSNMMNNTMIGNNNMNNNTMIGNNMNNTIINNNMNNNTMMGNMMNTTMIGNNNMNNTMIGNMMNNNTMMGNMMNNNTMMGNMMNNNTMMGNMMNNTMFGNMMNNNTMMGNMMNNTMIGNNNMNNTMIGNNMNNNTMIGNMMNNNSTMICNNIMNNNTMMDNNNDIMSKSSMINKNALYNHILNDPNKQKNTSLLSTLQCIYECFKDCEINFSGDLPNDKFASEIDEILKLIGRIPSNDNEKENFKKSIIKFRTEAAKYNPDYFKGDDEIEPICAFFGLCDYLNVQYRKNQNVYPNEIYKDVTEFENLPKEKFPEIYNKINQFVNEYHSPFANNFYYILLNISKCPNCNKIIKAEIVDSQSIASFIPLNGSLIDSIGNLVNDYISKQYNSNNSYCDNCKYFGPGKKEKGFLNTPKYLMLDFGEGEKDIKTLDNEIDLTYNSITNIGSKKYKVFAFITKEKNDKYKAYIKKDEKNWFSYSDENTIKEEIVCSNNITPYLAIYKGVESS